MLLGVPEQMLCDAILPAWDGGHAAGVLSGGKAEKHRTSRGRVREPGSHFRAAKAGLYSFGLLMMTTGPQLGESWPLHGVCACERYKFKKRI